MHWFTYRYCYSIIPPGFTYVANLIYLIQIFSHYYTILANPGIPHKSNYLSEELTEFMKNSKREKETHFGYFVICKTCNILITQERKVTHCDQCNICVYGKNMIKNKDLDHHCGVLGKCIAKVNLLSFKIFVGSTLCFIIYTMVINFFMVLVALNKH